MTQQQHIGGFWSYVHHDDEHESGRIVRLRDRLERSIRFFSGNRKFQIFLDRKDIGWGQKWVERLASSINDALLLFPMITPSYFASAPCREEALAFRDRQTSLNRDDLILPIYYLTAAHLENAGHGTPEEAEVATLLRAHQYEDWRALRDTPESDPIYAKAVERLAQKAVEALNRASPPRADAGTPAMLSPKSASLEKAGRSGGDAPASAESAQAMETLGDPEGKAEPGLIITFKVNPMPGRAPFTTISEAIARAPGGARILVEPGHYRESLVIDKPLELIGDGPCEDIIVEGEGATVLEFDTNIGVVRNLTFRQSDKKAQYYCLWIKQGRLELEDCDLSSTSLSCLAVINNADPRVRRNRIHGSAQSGLYILDNGRGTYEENEIFGNVLAGISVKTGADPVVRRNRVFDGRESGVYIFENGRGTFEDNEVFGNGLSGFAVASGAEPIVRRNRIYDGRQGGINIRDQARGTFEDNEIFGNNYSGIQVKTGADPIVRRNRIYDGRQGGMLLHENGRGTFEDNQIFGNNYSGIEVKAGAEPTVRRNRIRDGKQNGIYVHELGGGTFEGNQIDGNQKSGILVDTGGSPTARSNAITGNLLSGVRVTKSGGGVFEDNELSGNGKPWDIDLSAEARVKRSRNRET